MSTRTPEFMEYCVLAWSLRSRPKWLRLETITRWGTVAFAPLEKPADIEAWMDAAAARCSELCGTFNESDDRWLVPTEAIIDQLGSVPRHRMPWSEVSS